MRCQHDLLGLYSCVFKNLLEFLLSLPLEGGKSILPTTPGSRAHSAHPKHLGCQAAGCALLLCQDWTAVVSTPGGGGPGRGTFLLSERAPGGGE